MTGALSGLLSIVAVLAAYRWIRRRSAGLAILLACGVIGRAALGILLYLTSVFQWPLFPSLQLGDGFWALAIDARYYFNTAAVAASAGVGAIDGTAPSPAFLRALAAWLQVTGLSPAAAILFNLLCYVAIALIVVACCRSLVGAATGLFAVTVDPALVLFGTQALKDSLCVLAIVVMIAGIRVWCDGLDRHASRRALRLAMGAALVVVGICLVAGIRAYLAAFAVLGLAGAAAVATAVTNLPRWKIAGAYGTLIVLGWLAFAEGAGPYYPYYQSVLTEALARPLAPMLDLDRARDGFVSTGGATSMASPPLGASAAPPEKRESGRIHALAVHVLRLLQGVAVLTVPISVLRALHIVDFVGGRGLLFITDIDTLFIDSTVAVCLLLLFVRARRRDDLPVMVFATVMAVVAAVLLGYVVTNFGTLFRLRLVAAVPIWVLPALIPPAPAAQQPAMQAQTPRAIPA